MRDITTANGKIAQEKYGANLSAMGVTPLRSLVIRQRNTRLGLATDAFALLAFFQMRFANENRVHVSFEAS